MDIEKRLEELKRAEEDFKIDLLKEIKKEFEGYDKQRVTFVDPREEDFLHLPSEVQDELGILMDLRDKVSPLVMDKYCSIDGTATPAYVELTDEGLSLHVSGEDWDSEHYYVTLEKPDFGLTLNDLVGLVYLLRNDAVRKLNK